MVGFVCILTENNKFGFAPKQV